MRFDLLTIFPEYFAALDISLIGKARQEGRVDIRTHNLRDWATGRHLAVDDAPSGGGAGMVMRPDVWGRAIDACLPDPGAEDVVLAIPTPSGAPLTQRDLEDLSRASQIIVACGRYEGIDARVAEHYRREGVTVLEFSLGDYVLNGGEIAALALVEGVSRLLDGVIGNPESLAEESHSSAGLLEYPVYTQPRNWREEAVPDVLFGGNHAEIARWRRDQSLKRTAQRRPDMIAALAREDLSRLDKRDHEVLASCGIMLRPRLAHLTFSIAGEQDLAEVSDLASRTFPLACPPGTREEEIQDFVSTQLTEEALATLVRDHGARIGIVRARSVTGEEGLGRSRWDQSNRLGQQSQRNQQSRQGQQDQRYESDAQEGEGRESQRSGHDLRDRLAQQDQRPESNAQDREGRESRLSRQGQQNEQNPEENGPIIAYSLVEPGPPTELRHHGEDPCYFSKLYSDPDWHGSGVAGALLEFALEDAVQHWGAKSSILGTNRANKRAIRFYKHHGFRRVGRRTFNVGGTEHQDYVFVRDLTVKPPR